MKQDIAMADGIIIPAHFARLQPRNSRDCDSFCRNFFPVTVSN